MRSNWPVQCAAAPASGPVASEELVRKIEEMNCPDGTMKLKMSFLSVAVGPMSPFAIVLVPSVKARTSGLPGVPDKSFALLFSFQTIAPNADAVNKNSVVNRTVNSLMNNWIPSPAGHGISSSASSTVALQVHQRRRLKSMVLVATVLVARTSAAPLAGPSRRAWFVTSVNRVVFSHFNL